MREPGGNGGTSSDQVTRLDRPVTQNKTRLLAKRTGGDSAVNRTSTTTVTTPKEAMRVDELVRARQFYPVIMTACLSLLVILPFLAGDPVARWLFGAGLANYAIVATWFHLKIRNPDNFTERNLMVIGLAGVFAGFSAVYYWGVFSVAAVVLALGVHLNSLMGSFRYTIVVYALVAIAQGGLSILILTGVTPDRGLFTATEVGIYTKVVTQIFIQLILFAAVITARLARRATQEAIGELDQMLRSVGQRDALLKEARLEIERAAQVGDPGRFTDHVLGSFRLGVIIGRGGMGEVYAADHTETGEPAAIKILFRSALAGTDLLERFAREATIAGSLDSPHVVQTLEVGDGTDSIPYIAMERMTGHDLASHLRDKSTMPLGEVRVLVEQAALGLEAARQSGIVHRDMKPHNLFRSEKSGEPPVWKIFDFGVSKLAEQGGTLTKGAVVGTPSYMSPEQATSGKVDHRTDVYGLGGVAYRALTGYPPFTSGDLAATIYEVVHKMPARPRSRADVPSQVELVLSLALCKNPDDRFDTALALSAAFTAACERKLDPEIQRRAQDVLERMPWEDSVG